MRNFNIESMSIREPSKFQIRSDILLNLNIKGTVNRMGSLIKNADICRFTDFLIERFRTPGEK